MRLSIPRSRLELTWQLASSVPWLSCRQIHRLTGASVQTVANHRTLGHRLKTTCPRLRLYRLPLNEARQLVKRL